MGTGPYLDDGSAREFMGRALEAVREDDLAAIVADLERKSRGFAALLGPERLGPGLDRASLRALLRSVFATRRQADRILAAPGADAALAAALRDLMLGDLPVADRLEAFCAASPLDRATWSIDFATECLHFADPARHALWTRWMWDPAAGTGALPLVLSEEHALPAGRVGETYAAVCEAVAHVAREIEAAGLTLRARGPLAVDVFLVSVYVVYLYTVLRMRMTNEFSKVVPGLAELARRLLGTRALEV